MLLRLRARVKVNVVRKVYSDTLLDYVFVKESAVGVLITKYDISTLTSKFVGWDVQLENGEILRSVMEQDITEFPREKDEQESVEVVPTPEVV